MKIVHLNDHYEHVGGAETILFNWLDALEERGMINVIVHQHPSSVHESHRRSYQIPALGEIASEQRRAVADRFREILKEERPDLIHIHDIGNPDIAEVSLGFAPTVQTAFNHSFHCPGGDKYLPLLGRICERPFGAGCLMSAFITHCNSVRPHVLLTSYRRSHRMLKQARGLVFLAFSRYQAECFIQSGCPSQFVKVLPPFAVLPDWPPHKQTGTGQNTLLFAGRLVPQKGLDILLKSLKHLKSSFHLMIAGDGPDRGRAKRLAAELGLEKHIEFLGWLPKETLHEHYQQATVVIVPAVWPEPFGMVGIEAMSYGKPVVAFRVGGIPEWLEEGGTGFLIEPYEVKTMAEKIDYLLENPDIARGMGMMGRKKVEAEFNKGKHMTGLLSIYREALDGRVTS